MTGIELAVIAGASVTVGDALLVVGGIVSAVSSIQQANSEAAWSEYNAAISENDAIAAQQQSEFEADKHSDDVRRLQALQRVQVAESGTTVEGTNLDLIADSARAAELDRQAILYSGDVAASRSKSQANLDRINAASAKAAGPLNAGSAILGAVGSTKFGKSSGRSTGSPKAFKSGINTPTATI